MAVSAFNTLVVPLTFEVSSNTSLDLERTVEIEDGHWVVFTPATCRALSVAKRLSSPEGRLHLVHATTEISTMRAVYGPSQILNPENIQVLHADAARRAERALLQVAERFAPSRSLELHISPGRPLDHILAVVDQVGAQMVIAAASGRSTAKRVLVGSTVDKLVRSCTCPVTVIPG